MNDFSYVGDEEFVKRVVGLLKTTFDIGKEKTAIPFRYLGVDIATTGNSNITHMRGLDNYDHRVVGSRNIKPQVAKRKCDFLLTNVKSRFQHANNSFNELFVTSVKNHPREQSEHLYSHLLEFSRKKTGIKLRYRAISVH